jgi:DNA adenine methylase
MNSNNELVNQLNNLSLDENENQQKTNNKTKKSKSKTKNQEINNNQSLNPIVKWSGGKKDELNHILPHIPSYDTYLEPFIGGGALFFHLKPNKAVINDVHKELTDFYLSIKNGHSNDIYNFMKEHPNEEETYYKVRNYDNTECLNNAKRFYYLRKTCFRGMLRYNKSGKFNIPFGRYKTCNFEDLKNIEYENLLKNTDVFNQSFEYIFDNYDNPNHFMFLDPPYDSEFTDYGYCSFGKKEQKILANKFKNTSIKCLMIIGKTAFIEELYKDYIVGEYDKKYRFKLHSGRVGDEINTKHLIIKNY